MSIALLTVWLFAATASIGSSEFEDPTPWLADEHRMLADSALVQTLRLISPTQSSLSTPFGFTLARGAIIFDNASFADLSVRFAENDGSTDRFQVAQQTVLQQLSELTADDIDQIWNERPAATLNAHTLPVRKGPKNAVAQYLIHHILAIRFAEASATGGQDAESAFRAMLVYEAVAQGYLHDALSSSHMLVPRHDFMPWIHTLNSKSAHKNYADYGLYVVNGLGVAYQAHGEGSLAWYGPNFRITVAAARASLASVLYAFLVKRGGPVPPALKTEVEVHILDQDQTGMVDAWLASRNGADYYSSANMPGLLNIPTPVAATWSIRKEKGRVHFPQLAEQGHHDPDLPDYLLKELHSVQDVPDAMALGFLGSDSEVRTQIDAVDTLASVEFIQEHRIHPSYHGIVFGVSGGAVWSGGDANPAMSASVGYGFENFIVTKNVSVLAGLTVVTNGGPTLVHLSAAGNLPSLPIHLEVGAISSTDSMVDDVGLGLGAAIDLWSPDLGFTYLGAIVRLRYDAKIFNGDLHAVSLQAVFH